MANLSLCRCPVPVPSAAGRDFEGSETLSAAGCQHHHHQQQHPRTLLQNSKVSKSRSISQPVVQSSYRYTTTGLARKCEYCTPGARYESVISHDSLAPDPHPHLPSPLYTTQTYRTVPRPDHSEKYGRPHRTSLLLTQLRSTSTLDSVPTLSQSTKQGYAQLYFHTDTYPATQTSPKLKRLPVRLPSSPPFAPFFDSSSSSDSVHYSDRL